MSDELIVVTVTYSPGLHLDRFLASLSHATDRPVTVIMADNGSTDGAPEEALERYPNVRLLRTGGNLGYGTAVNRAVAEYLDGLAECADFFVVANPDVQWGPRSIDVLLEAAARWPRAGSLGPLIRDPDGSVYPSARHLPSLIRGGMHAVVGPVWKSNPWTAAYRQERLEPSERPVGWLSGSCLLLRRAAFDEVVGFDERYFMYMEDVDLGDRLGKAGWQNVYVPSAEILHDKGHATGRDPARNLAAHHTSTYTFLADRHAKWWQAPLRWTMRGALAARAGLVVRNSRTQSGRKDGASESNPAEVDAVILVGGQGTRLRPLTLSAPKPMLPTAGLPFLTHLLSRIAEAGIEHVVLGTVVQGGGVRVGVRRRVQARTADRLRRRGRAAGHRRRHRQRRAEAAPRHRDGVQRRRAVRRRPARAAGLPRARTAPT